MELLEGLDNPTLVLLVGVLGYGFWRALKFIYNRFILVLDSHTKTLKAHSDLHVEHDKDITELKRGYQDMKDVPGHVEKISEWVDKQE